MQCWVFVSWPADWQQLWPVRGKKTRESRDNEGKGSESSRDKSQAQNITEISGKSSEPSLWSKDKRVLMSINLILLHMLTPRLPHITRPGQLAARGPSSHFLLAGRTLVRSHQKSLPSPAQSCPIDTKCKVSHLYHFLI